jgi:hypothetical protein
MWSVLTGQGPTEHRSPAAVLWQWHEGSLFEISPTFLSFRRQPSWWKKARAHLCLDGTCFFNIFDAVDPGSITTLISELDAGGFRGVSDFLAGNVLDASALHPSFLLGHLRDFAAVSLPL